MRKLSGKDFLLFFLTAILIFISVREQYPAVILRKMGIWQPAIDFRENVDYQLQIGLYPYYRKRAAVVMLGNSLTYRVNWNELLNRNDIANRGVGKDITTGLRHRLDYVYAVKPELCFIMGGINDLVGGLEPKEAVDNLQSIGQQLLQQNIQPVFQSVLYVSPDCPGHQALNRKILEINQLISDFCREREIRFVDLNASMGLVGDAHPSLYLADGVHLSGKGYEKWGSIILPIIEKEIE